MKRTNLLLFTLLSICLCACTQKGNQAESISQEASYPVAEWDRATAILMHTPGQELFDGVIHPSAGLFENYFDVDKAADEHRGYISALEKNGIKVFTVEQILNETPIENCVSTPKILSHSTYQTFPMPMPKRTTTIV